MKNVYKRLLPQTEIRVRCFPLFSGERASFRCRDGPPEAQAGPGSSTGFWPRNVRFFLSLLGREKGRKDRRSEKE